jgi:uncharacterized protein (DUF697 family)
MPEPKKPRFRRQFTEQPAAEPPVPAQGSPPADPEEFLEINREKSPEVVLNQLGENAVFETQTHPATGPKAATSATHETATAEATPTGATAEINRLKADIIITRHVAVAAGAGFIPVPLVDFAAITGVQLSMLALICDIYKQPFSKEAAMSIIASLAGGAIAGGEASSMAIGSRLKFIPVVGTVASWLVTPAVAALTTYAIGKVFVHHLECGGSLLTFEAKKMKEYMDKALHEGKKLLPHWGTASAAEAPAPAPSA